MNLWKRQITFWLMFWHMLERITHGEFHIERCETYGPKLFGIYCGVVFVSRYCHTCGYLKGQYDNSHT